MIKAFIYGIFFFLFSRGFTVLMNLVFKKAEYNLLYEFKVTSDIPNFKMLYRYKGKMAAVHRLKAFE